MTETIRHSWDLSAREAIALQKELAGRVQQVSIQRPVRTVAGVDCAFFDQGRQIVAAAVLMDAQTLDTIATAYSVSAVHFPYVPGLLTFREAPTELDAIAQLPQRPDLLMVDGAGIAHPRRLGIAAHLGLWLGLPTIGVAKSRLFGKHRAVGQARGSVAELTDHDEVIGAVLRTRDAVRPLFISVGNCITLEESLKWVLRCAKGYRLPEPTRAADRVAGQLKTGLTQP